jgi:hypothetical protein
MATAASAPPHPAAQEPMAWEYRVVNINIEGGNPPEPPSPTSDSDRLGGVLSADFLEREFPTQYKAGGARPPPPSGCPVATFPQRPGGKELGTTAGCPGGAAIDVLFQASPVTACSSCRAGSRSGIPAPVRRWIRVMSCPFGLKLALALHQQYGRRQPDHRDPDSSPDL